MKRDQRRRSWCLACSGRRGVHCQWPTSLRFSAHGVGHGSRGGGHERASARLSPDHRNRREASARRNIKPELPLTVAEKPARTIPRVVLDANIAIGAEKPPGGPDIARIGAGSMARLMLSRKWRLPRTICKDAGRIVPLGTVSCRSWLRFQASVPCRRSSGASGRHRKQALERLCGAQRRYHSGHDLRG